MSPSVSNPYWRHLVKNVNLWDLGKKKRHLTISTKNIKHPFWATYYKELLHLDDHRFEIIPVKKWDVKLHYINLVPKLAKSITVI